MAFGKLSEWFPNQTHIDPRLSEKYSTGSKYAVVSVSRFPTYRELSIAGKTISDTKMVGLVQSFQAPQTRPIQRLFELGSRYPYSVAGKFMGNIQMSSIMFDAGANLIGGIYEEAFMKKTATGSTYGDLTQAGKDLLNTPLLYDETEIPYPYDNRDVGGQVVGGVSKDWGAIRMSLDDNRMDIPFGLVVTLFQSSKRIKTGVIQNGDVTGDTETFRPMTCLFFEMVKLEDYSFDLNANQELISEYARFFYTGLVNIKTSLQSQPSTGDRNVVENTVPSGVGGGGVSQ